jgi:putative transcriptional regulator
VRAGSGAAAHSARKFVAPIHGGAADVPIVVTLDVMLARRKMRSRELAERVGITEANLSLLKSGKVRGVRFDTLARICEVLQCQPGELLAWEPGPEPEDGGDVG